MDRGEEGLTRGREPEEKQQETRLEICGGDKIEPFSVHSDDGDDGDDEEADLIVVALYMTSHLNLTTVFSDIFTDSLPPFVSSFG